MRLAVAGIVSPPLQFQRGGTTGMKFPTLMARNVLKSSLDGWEPSSKALKNWEEGTSAGQSSTPRSAPHIEQDHAGWTPGEIRLVLEDGPGELQPSAAEG